MAGVGGARVRTAAARAHEVIRVDAAWLGVLSSTQVSSPDQQIPGRVLFDTHQPRVARNPRKSTANTILTLFSISYIGLARLAPQLA